MFVACIIIIIREGTTDAGALPIASLLAPLFFLFRCRDPNLKKKSTHSTSPKETLPPTFYLISQ